MVVVVTAVVVVSGGGGDGGGGNLTYCAFLGGKFDANSKEKAQAQAHPEAAPNKRAKDTPNPKDAANKAVPIRY